MNPRLLQILIAIMALGIIGFGAYQSFKLLYKPPVAAPKPKVISLTDYLTTPSTSVRYEIIGPVTAPEKHVEQTFMVSSTARNLSVTKAYGEVPDYQQSFDFNQAAFEDFMRALQNAGFTAGAGTTSTATEIGDCPSGTRSVYELMSGDTTVFRTWYSTCDHGTFKGSAGSIRSLFLAQYPTLSKLPNDLRM